MGNQLQKCSDLLAEILPFTRSGLRRVSRCTEQCFCCPFIRGQKVAVAVEVATVQLHGTVWQYLVLSTGNAAEIKASGFNKNSNMPAIVTILCLKFGFVTIQWRHSDYVTLMMTFSQIYFSHNLS
jgi:hypothetical protein